eukprot:6173229-Pleurochrysis_carterae.AAC.1
MHKHTQTHTGIHKHTQARTGTHRHAQARTQVDRRVRVHAHLNRATFGFCGSQLWRDHAQMHIRPAQKSVRNARAGDRQKRKCKSASETHVQESQEVCKTRAHGNDLMMQDG